MKTVSWIFTLALLGSSNIIYALPHENELTNKFRSRRPLALQEIEGHLNDKKKETQQHVEKKKKEERFKHYVELYKIKEKDRFSKKQQDDLISILQKVIPNIESERKISHASDEQITQSVEGMDFSSLKKKFLSFERKPLLTSRKEEEDLKTPEPKKSAKVYHYNNRDYVCIHAPDRDITDLVVRHNRKAMSFDEILKTLNVHTQSAAFKAFPKETKNAQDKLKELFNKSSGFVILPTGKNNPHHSAVVKAQRQGTPVYFFYNSKLIRNFPNDVIYNKFKENYTFVTLSNKNFVFAVPHAGADEEILSLSTKQVLLGHEAQELSDQAKRIWRDLSIKQKTPVSKSEAKPAVQKAAAKPTIQKKDAPKPEAKPAVQKAAAKPTIQKKDAPKPEAKPTVQKAVARPIIQKQNAPKPVTKPAVQQLAAKPTVQKAVARPIIQKQNAPKPVTKPAVQQLAAKPTVQKQAPKPVAKPAVQQVAAKPTVQKQAPKPVAKPAVKKPLVKATSQKQASKQVSRRPIRKPIAQKPTTKSAHKVNAPKRRPIAKRVAHLNKKPTSVQPRRVLAKKPAQAKSTPVRQKKAIKRPAKKPGFVSKRISRKGAK